MDQPGNSTNRTLNLSYFCVLSQVLFFLLIFLGLGTHAYALPLKKLDFEFVVHDGKVVNKTTTLRVEQRSHVSISWISNLKAEIHLHGYDKLLMLKPGKKNAMVFIAHASGRFPVTLHKLGSANHSHGHKAIAYIEVHPK